jgi:hypothetical protein
MEIITNKIKQNKTRHKKKEEEDINAESDRGKANAIDYHADCTHLICLASIGDVQSCDYIDVYVTRHRTSIIYSECLCWSRQVISILYRLTSQEHDHDECSF